VRRRDDTRLFKVLQQGKELSRWVGELLIAAVLVLGYVQNRDARQNAAMPTATEEAGSQHPVWEVYDSLRTVYLNDYYWTMMLQRARRINTFLEIFLAIAVPSSAVAGLQFWQAQYGAYVWGAITIAAAVAAVAKPFLGLDKSIQSYEAAVARYRTLEGQLQELRSEIRHTEVYNQVMKQKYLYIQASMGRALEAEPYEEINDRIRDRAEERVKRELPPDKFYVPEV